MKRSIIFQIISLFIIFINLISAAKLEAEALLPAADAATSEIAAADSEDAAAISSEKKYVSYCKKTSCWCGRNKDYSYYKVYCPISAVNSCYIKYGHCVRKGNYCWWKYTYNLRNCLKYAW
jgi:hypothetical protein